MQIANQELARWGDGRIKETDPRLRKTLQGYWKTGAGRSISERQLADPAFQNANPWSAAFMSWLMKTAGAGDAFKSSGYHSAYIRAAIDNRVAGNSNPFKAYRIAEVSPQVGDLVCKSRAGSGATYDNVRPPMKTHCDIVTAVEPGRLTIVGGNVGNSVAQRKLRTDAGGHIAEPGYFAVIQVDERQRPVPVPPAGTPRLVRRESTPPGSTLYVEIDLKITDKAGMVAPSVTGVFVPEGYQPAAAVDLVLYLHGFKADAIKHEAIDQYWNARRFPYAALREGVNASGRNVVLVAPTLGSRSEAGSLLKPGGLDSFHRPGSVGAYELRPAGFRERRARQPRLRVPQRRRLADAAVGWRPGSSPRPASRVLGVRLLLQPRRQLLLGGLGALAPERKGLHIRHRRFTYVGAR